MRAISASTIEDREIWARANLLPRQHGEATLQPAADWAWSLREQREIDGYQAFQLIAARIRDLEPTTATHRGSLGW